MKNDILNRTTLVTLIALTLSCCSCEEKRRLKITVFDGITRNVLNGYVSVVRVTNTGLQIGDVNTEQHVEKVDLSMYRPGEEFNIDLTSKQTLFVTSGGYEEAALEISGKDALIISPTPSLGWNPIRIGIEGTGFDVSKAKRTPVGDGGSLQVPLFPTKAN